MVDSLKSVRTRKTATPQTQKAVKGQKKNSAGGYTFAVGGMERAKRFLILGSESSFYQSGAKMSQDNAKIIEHIAQTEKARELIDLIVDVSVAGRAPKQQPALFALALAITSATDPAVKNYGYSKLAQVARTGTALFEFAGYLNQFQRFGMGARKAVAAWYTSKDVNKLAYQLVKYQQREGWSHKDLITLSHPSRSKSDAEFSALIDWSIGKANNQSEAPLPKVIQGFELSKEVDIKNLPALIREYGLTWEMIPPEALNNVKVWDALLDGNVPLGALLRQLPRLTNLGVISPLGGRTQEIVDRLTNQEELVRARIHPLKILVSLKTYAGGRSLRGDGSWKPVQRVVAALDEAFYLAFKAVEPANKRTLIALDVSGSMGFNNIAGLPIKPSEAVAALALVTAATEPETYIVGFGAEVRDLGISPRMRLDGVMYQTSRMTFGATDAAAAIVYATKQNLKVDTFIVMTDNETYAGRSHPFEALKTYRSKTGIDAKLIVVATTATKFSIADPSDAGMLDIAGFDTAVPGLISEFSKGL